MCSRESANGVSGCRERHCVSLREQSLWKLPWIQSHFPLPGLAMLSLLCWIQRGAPDPNNEFPFQSQMSLPCEQMNLTETRSVNKSWTLDNTMIPSLDGRHRVVERGADPIHERTEADGLLLINLDESQWHYAERKKPISKGCMLYNSRLCHFRKDRVPVMENRWVVPSSWV